MSDHTDKTPNALRRHVVLAGPANAGKSTLFNALTGQEHAIVSPVPGTTTDPVSKAMELIPFGPIVLIDTAGLDDTGQLGVQRIHKTKKVLRRADAGIYVADANTFREAEYLTFTEERIPHLLVFTKTDEMEPEKLRMLKHKYPDGLYPAGPAEAGEIREHLSKLLSETEPEVRPLIGDLVPEYGTVVLVTPIDSEAPRGRLILPQIQVLRECLDYGIQAMVCRESELERALKSLQQVDLVVTDSQVFAYVDKRVPQNVPLTSFSMLLARQKGDFLQLLAGAGRIPELGDDARILMLEGCTHNHTHEDIGRVKLPGMLRQKTGKRLHFDYFGGYDFPADLSGYDLAIQCGSCMINSREIQIRLEKMEEAGVAVTNYGIALAYGAGILERAAHILTAGATSRDIGKAKVIRKGISQ